MVHIVAIGGLLAMAHGGTLAAAAEILPPPPQDWLARFWFD